MERARFRIHFLSVLAAILLADAAFAQDIPLKNWTVPALTRELAGAQAGVGIAPQTHLVSNSPAVFVTIQPCRLEDSRVSSGGMGPIPGGGERTYDFVPAAGTSCETLPPGLLALSLNFTVVGTLGPGFLYAYPVGGAPPPVATLNYTGAAGELRNNAAIVPVDPVTGGFVVGTGVSGTDVIIDLNGAFLSTLEVGTTLTITSTAVNPAIIGVNISGTNGGIGVLGSAGTMGTVFGVVGQTTSVNGVSAGVKGVTGVEAALQPALVPIAGVVGTSAIGDGVRGVSQQNSSGSGVTGLRTSAAGSIQSSGSLGFSTSVAGFFEGDVTITGDLDVLGASKSFVEPHPTDASKAIRYVSLEGAESGTYFRGRARFENGLARIAVPEDFRLTTAPEGLTVQVTPIGEMASYAVVRIGLDQIVVQSSRNVEFFYLVNGVRRANTGFQPIENAGTRFVPLGPRSRLSQHLPEESRRRLVANGTFNADGTVNMDTARRLGWDRIWAEREREEPPPQRQTPEP